MQINVARPPTFAVVGTGASGVGVFTALVRALMRADCAAGAEILVFDPGERPGAGVAFSSPHDCHLMNMRVGTMSVRAEDPEHFIRWLKARQAAAGDRGASDYVPRHLYADYLGEHFTEVLQDARHAGIRVSHYRATVSDCWEDAHGVHLVADNSRFLADYAFLCLGNLPSTDYQELLPVPAYIHSIWKDPGLECVEPDAAVGIIGTNLTAIDALLRLRERGHRGPISCFSRRRPLPKVQGPRVDYHCKYVTFDEIQKMTGGFSRKLELAEVAGLFRRELEEGLGLALDWPRVLAYADTPVPDALARDIRLAESGQTLWYSILDATSEILPVVWKILSPAAQATFLAEYNAFWMTFRHCMPLDNARRLLRMARDGVFEVLTGLNSVGYDEQSAVFRLAGRRGQESFTREVSYLVNATGTGFALNRSDSPLVQNMLRRGNLATHPGGGVAVDFETLRLIRGDGVKSERVSCIGPLTRGVHFFTSAFETNLRNGENAVTAAVAHFQRAARGKRDAQSRGTAVATVRPGGELLANARSAAASLVSPR